MKYLLVILLSAAIYVFAQDLDQDVMINQALLFQDLQIQMNATAAANLFTEDGITNIPVGTITKGRSQIESNWKKFFNGMQSLDEFITTEITASGNTVAFGKVIKGVTKDKQCPLNYFVINWFAFNENYQITEFSAVFNLTQVIEQRNC